MKTEKMKDNLNLTAVFVPASERGYTAYIEEIRGAVSEGESLEEAEANLIDALEMVLETAARNSRTLKFSYLAAKPRLARQKNCLLCKFLAC